ncbi:DUF4173 domain-containing protein [Bosea sp. F3-2]|uniref:DUF4153 domain-containing protein n=1 Tax=Bosea sp. F3-2 TaxID=2599640 RepID=UPI0011EE1019|nr:DUF4173 domain-containing protein [Bosea sp. F3-2]QEL22226.1 DUF4173 domain-containing protein [Bosea sp. F3-2]
MPVYASEHDTLLPRAKRPAGWLTIQLAAAAALVALADALFYGHRLGISLALFLAALAAASACLNPIRAESARRWRAVILLAAGILPVVEDINWLSVTIALITTAVCARTLIEVRDLPWLEHLRAALRMPFSGIFRLFSDFARASRYGARRKQRTGILSGLLGWMVPLLFCAVFISLFVSANPLLESWLSRIDILAMLGQLFSGRSVFWAVMLCLIWPLVRIRSLRLRKRSRPAPSTAMSALHPLDPLSDQTVRRSLVLFNGLFAIQTAMDIVYLWGGASLPAGLSHASYAHRGAYPLVVTALLAAAFVLVAMRPSGSSERDPLVRPLVLAWVGQNILLVLSALLRLDLYVDAYSLTGLRLAAFVWMLLVAAGLVLILAQILTRRTVGWLVSANMVALALTLYTYSFVDTAVVIANYNLRHSFEMRGEGQHIDIPYLFGLGPHAIPAIDRYVPRIAAAGHVPPHSPWTRYAATFAARRDRLAQCHHRSQGDWRGWSFRGWRLSRYLANTREAPFKTMPVSPADTPEGR